MLMDLLSALDMVDPSSISSHVDNNYLSPTISYWILDKDHKLRYKPSDELVCQTTSGYYMIKLYITSNNSGVFSLVSNIVGCDKCYDVLSLP